MAFPTFTAWNQLQPRPVGSFRAGGAAAAAAWKCRLSIEVSLLAAVQAPRLHHWRTSISGHWLG